MENETQQPSPSRREIRAQLLSLHKQVIQKRVRYHRAYQPISIGDIRTKKTVRECNDRWEIVESTIRKTEASSLIDLGCAEGYFVRKAGELGCFAVGVDRDYNRLGLIENARMFDRSKQSAFMLAAIEPEFLQKLPQFDIVLCFSVMHHIIRHNSLEYGLEVLKLMRAITRKSFIFDMGQTNETSTAWAERLPDMGADPAVWITDFLHKGGFKRVELVGKTDAYKDDVPRYVFECLI